MLRLKEMTLNSTNPEVRSEAYRSLGYLADHSITQECLAQLNAPESEQRERAFFALVAYLHVKEDAHVLEALRASYLREPEDDLRVGIALEFARRRIDLDRDFLLAQLQECGEDPNIIQVDIAAALANLGDPTGLATLENMFCDSRINDLRFRVAANWTDMDITEEGSVREQLRKWASSKYLK